MGCGSAAVGGKHPRICICFLGPANYLPVRTDKILCIVYLLLNDGAVHAVVVTAVATGVSTGVANIPFCIGAKIIADWETVVYI